MSLYEPAARGLDCGVSFGRTLIKSIPDSISVLIIPTAVGGCSVGEWLGDSVHRKVKLLSNFRAKVDIAKKYGQIKAILWHQGENDANPVDIPQYKSKLSSLFAVFRKITQNKNLPILIGELGSYSKEKENWKLLNEKINEVSKNDSNTFIISTSDLKDRGDKLHFNSAGQRAMGERMAVKFLNTLK